MSRKSFAIIGNPIDHSLSPILHEYWFKKYNINATYKLLKANEDSLRSITNKIRNNELAGINVTLPYKQKIIPFVDNLINDARTTNSVNTIFLNDEGVLVGENTDVFGLQAAYLKEMSHTQNKALVIGSGGVAPSVVLSLQKSKINNILIINELMRSLYFKKI